jgi:alpha-tubulin suppressor-like RCC1 family protein
MVITAALDTLTDDRVNSLNLIDDLPEAYDVSPGTIFFVKEINTLVYASARNKWKGLDGRVLREDPIRALSWGNNSNARLGDGTTTDRSSPVTVVGGITNWSQVSASIHSPLSSNHILGIAGGVAYGWGNNIDGRLGDGTTILRSSPVTVVGGITNWSQVSAGGSRHSAGIAGGVAYAWGYNGQGRLGDNTTINRSSPVTVVGGITNWSQVSAGNVSTLGIAGGVAYAWGNNENGKLGDNTIIVRSSPVTVVGGITNWSQVSAGDTHSIGIASGIAYAWGNNSNGRLGDGSAVMTSSPVTVTGGITNWSQVSAGAFHSLGIANGIAYAWGAASGSSLGVLGNNSGFTVATSPVTVVGGITNWTELSAGRYHSLGIAGGIAYAWGNNSNGRLGDNTVITRSSPVTVVGGITSWTHVSGGSSESFAIKVD